MFLLNYFILRTRVQSINVIENVIDIHASNIDIDTSSLPQPYKNVKTVLPFDDHGWYGNAPWVEKIFFFNPNITTVIEIGSWLGKSTRHIARLLPKQGSLYSIDTWEGSTEHYVNPFYKEKIATLYDQFLSNTIRAKLTDKIIPIKSDSALASVTLASIKPDLIYLDAAHDTNSVLRDLTFWYPFIKGNKGILCGDDWTWDSVKIALREFCADNNLTLYVNDNFWFIKETGVFTEKNFINQNDDIWIFSDIR
jgi:hypothetical protein